LQQPFFFLIGPASWLLLDRPKSANLFVDTNQVLAEFLESMELADLLLRFAQCGRIGKRFRNALSGHSPSQTELRVVTGVIRSRAMAGWLTAAAHCGCDRTGTHIPEAEEFFKNPGSLRFQHIERLRHGLSFLNVIVRSERCRKKRKPATSHFCVAHPAEVANYSSLLEFPLL
jgi:hypothetical protein